VLNLLVKAGVLKPYKAEWSIKKHEAKSYTFAAAQGTLGRKKGA
jgi:hypothetical protein